MFKQPLIHKDMAFNSISHMTCYIFLLPKSHLWTYVQCLLGVFNCTIIVIRFKILFLNINILEVRKTLDS